MKVMERDQNWSALHLLKGTLPKSPARREHFMKIENLSHGLI